MNCCSASAPRRQTAPDPAAEPAIEARPARWALALEYLGAAGNGWQSQSGDTGIADLLLRALKQISPPCSPIVAAGRTDSGVHALGQVVHFDLPPERKLPARAWLLGVNRLLPPGVRVRWARRVAGDFHARFSASRRSYVYLAFNAAVLPALWQGRAALERRHLDTEAMQQAAAELEGEHDFSAFRSSRCSSPTAVRHLHRLRVGRRGRLVFVELCANAFLQRMARILVGSLWQVGLGRLTRHDLRQILQSKDRVQAADTAVAEGLYFLGPDYPPEFGVLAAPGLESVLTGGR